MARKKYYAVRKGMMTGIFESWEECEAATAGYSNAEFKSFAVLEEAKQYVDSRESSAAEEMPRAGGQSAAKVIAYVDGSYDDALKKYSFGCIILTPSGEIVKECGNGDNPDSLAIRNVAGEMLGAMFAVKWALINGYAQIELRYDYAGIEKWVTGEWKAKNGLTIKYAGAMNDWKKDIGISFRKVAAHSNNPYNDMADALAKSALKNGNGIPRITRPLKNGG